MLFVYIFKFWIGIIFKLVQFFTQFVQIYFYNDNVIIMYAVAIVTMTTPMCEDGGPLKGGRLAELL